MGFEASIILLLVLVNGVLAMSEIALVSVRKSRIRQKAEEGDRRAQVALELIEDPTKLLSTVQLGITLVGMLAGVFGGATLAKRLEVLFHTIPYIAPHAEIIAVGTVVVIITFLSLVIGELVPKRIGLGSSEPIALWVAIPVRMLAIVAAPLITFFSMCTDAVIRFLGFRKSTLPTVTEEELQEMIEQGEEAGVLDETERIMAERSLRLGERRVNAIMTPREDVVWLNLENSPEKIWENLLNGGHAFLPVCEGSFDYIVGFIARVEFLGVERSDIKRRILAGIRKPLFVSDNLPVVRVLEQFRKHRQTFALVVDEHGTFEGLVTLIDILADLMGDIPISEEHEEPPVITREDGSWLIDGRYPLSDLPDIIGLDDLPEGSNETFHTLGGLVMAMLSSLPMSGNHFTWHNFRFEVVDMDGRRVDKVLVSRIPSEQAQDAQS